MNDHGSIHKDKKTFDEIQKIVWLRVLRKIKSRLFHLT